MSTRARALGPGRASKKEAARDPSGARPPGPGVIRKRLFEGCACDSCVRLSSMSPSNELNR